MLFDKRWAKSKTTKQSCHNRITKEEREEILALFLVSPEAASRLAIRHGLDAMYAYKLARARGVVPRTGVRWGKLRETS